MTQQVSCMCYINNYRRGREFEKQGGRWRVGENRWMGRNNVIQHSGKELQCIYYIVHCIFKCKFKINVSIVIRRVTSVMKIL